MNLHAGKMETWITCMYHCSLSIYGRQISSYFLWKITQQKAIAGENYAFHPAFRGSLRDWVISTSSVNFTRFLPVKSMRILDFKAVRELKDRLVNKKPEH